MIFFTKNNTITTHDLLHFTSLKKIHKNNKSTQKSNTNKPIKNKIINNKFDLTKTKHKIKLHYIKHTLEQTNKNITKTTKLLNIKHPQLSQKIKKYQQKNQL